MAISWLETGKRFLAKDYIKAIKAFKKTVKENNKNFLEQAHFELGKAYLVLKKYDLAKRHLLEANRLNGSNAQASILLGKAFKFLGDYKRAVKFFGNLLWHKKDEFLPEVYSELGETYLLKKNYDFAKKYLLKAKRLNGSNLFLELFLGKTFKYLGKYEKAVCHLKKAIGFKAAAGCPEKELAEIYDKLGETGLSIKYLERHSRLTDNLTGKNEASAELSRKKIREIQRLNYEGKIKQVLKKARALNKSVSKGCPVLSNIIKSEAEIAKRKIKLSSKVRNLDVVLTNRCNLRCVMCERKDEKKWDLPKKTIKAIEKITPYLERVSWQGGEVFLYKGFEGLLEQFGKCKVKQVVFTNGMLLTKRLMLELIKYNVDMIFSLDGATKKVYENIRCGANFDVLTKKLKLFKDLREKINPNLGVHLNVVVMKKNYRQLNKFVDFAKKYGFTSLAFMPVYCKSELLSERLGIGSGAQIRKYLKKSFEKIGRKAKNCGIKFEQWVLPDNALRKGERPDIKRVVNGQRNPDKNKLFCHIPWLSLFIDLEGRIKPGCFCGHYIGNIKYDNIDKIWNGKRMLSYRKKLLSGNIKDFCNPDCLKRVIPEINLKYVV